MLEDGSFFSGPGSVYTSNVARFSTVIVEALVILSVSKLMSLPLRGILARESSLSFFSLSAAKCFAAHLVSTRKESGVPSLLIGSVISRIYLGKQLSLPHWQVVFTGSTCCASLSSSRLLDPNSLSPESSSSLCMDVSSSDDLGL